MQSEYLQLEHLLPETRLNRMINLSSLQLLTKFECEVDLGCLVIVKVSFGVVAEISAYLVKLVCIHERLASRQHM